MFFAFPARVRERIRFDGFASPRDVGESDVKFEPHGKTRTRLTVAGLGEITMKPSEFQAFARAVREHERRE